MLDQELFRYAALFFFSSASFGFLYFHLRYGRDTKLRLWGIRLSHALGFIGVLMHWSWVGEPNELTLLMISALTVSLVGFELAQRFLR